MLLRVASIMESKLDTEKGRVLYIARQLNMTVSELSASIGMSKTAISTTLSRGGLSLSVYDRLLDRYGISTDWLRHGIGKPFVKKR